MLCTFRAVSVLATLLSLATAASAQFSFQALSGGSGSSLLSNPFALSGDGRIVVGSIQVNSVWQSVLWNQGAAPISLGGAGASYALGTSFDGSLIVGQADSAGGREAFRWTAGAGMVGLGDLAGIGPFASSALGVSANGSVIVGQTNRSIDGSYALRAFRWTAIGGMTELPDLPGGPLFSCATDVTPDGSLIVGGATGVNGQEAVIWNPDGSVTALGDLPGGGVSSRALAVSADGSVVVGMGVSSAGFEAFRWTRATGMVGLGSLAGPSDFASRASDVSADGNVIVGIGSGAADFNGEAFVWFPGTGMLNLRDYLLSHGVTAVQSWRLVDAASVSADGRTICGYGVNPQGQGQSWVAHIEIDTSVPAPDVTEILAPNGFSVTSGSLVSGGVPQLVSSDNAYLRLSGTATRSMQAWFSARASRASARELRFRIEAAADRSATRQDVALFDYAAQTWVTLSSGSATSADSTIEVRVTDRAARFIEPGTQRMMARVTFVPSAGKKATEARVDQVVWTRIP